MWENSLVRGDMINEFDEIILHWNRVSDFSFNIFEWYCACAWKYRSFSFYASVKWVPLERCGEPIVSTEVPTVHILLPRITVLAWDANSLWKIWKIFMTMCGEWNVDFPVVIDHNRHFSSDSKWYVFNCISVDVLLERQRLNEEWDGNKQQQQKEDKNQRHSETKYFTQPIVKHRRAFKFFIQIYFVFIPELFYSVFYSLVSIWRE